MPVERRGWVIAFEIGSTGNGRNPIFNGRRQPSRGGTSRMTRECQVRFCERLGVTRVLLPAWMTENSAATLPMVAAPRLSLDALRELRGLIDAQRLSSSPSSETNRMGGGDDGTTCRMTTARSPGARNQRKPAPATRSDDSRGGHGAAQVAYSSVASFAIARAALHSSITSAETAASMRMLPNAIHFVRRP
jgi:hypothetical protein